MRTCILQTHSEVNEDLYQLTLPNHAAYAGRHGYDMHQVNRTYKEIWWGIEDLILDLLPRYDRVLTVGSDVIFTDIDRPLDHFDDGVHNVFVQTEGLSCSPTINFDLVLWSGSDGVRMVIEQLRQTRADYETHPWGLQWGMTMLSKDARMAERHIKTYPPRFMQSAPYPNTPGTWHPGDFALHFVGMSNVRKLSGCKHYLETGEVIWGKQVGQNDALKT